MGIRVLAEIVGGCAEGWLLVGSWWSVIVDCVLCVFVCVGGGSLRVVVVESLCR